MYTVPNDTYTVLYPSFLNFKGEGVMRLSGLGQAPVPPPPSGYVTVVKKNVHLNITMKEWFKDSEKIILNHFHSHVCILICVISIAHLHSFEL